MAKCIFLLCKTVILYMLLVGMAITAFTACSDDDDYQPAQKVAEDNMGAYFAAANAASEVLTPEEYAARPTVDLKVKRQNTKGDVSIPVVVDKADSVSTLWWYFLYEW